jgi:hypothetical protein
MTTKHLFLILFIANLSPFGYAKQKPILQVINESLEFSAQQSKGLFEKMVEIPERLPRTVKDGELVTSKDSWWTSGFFPGTLWYLYEYSKTDDLKQAAQVMTRRVEKQQYTTDNHDVGFMIYCSYGNGLRLLKEKSYEQVIINAAKSLSTRFNSTTGTIKSWDNRQWQYPVIIDNMMNLELLTQATEISGDSSFYKIAVTHADTTLKYHFRPDGSSYHLVNYDTIKGGYVERVTVQGFADESSWTRGQSWGLYGYTMMYRETRKKEYLEHAIKIANFIANHPNLPKDKIPYWDFNAPNIPNALRDASAGAVIASALVELSTFTDKKLSKKYRTLAEQMIRSLASPAYRAELGQNGNFILKHSVGFMAKNSEVDAPLSYADYYFVEALMRYRKLFNKK